MNKKADNEKAEKAPKKPGGFLARLMDKLDRKLEKKAAQAKCSCGPKDGKGSSCC